jgi:hypothetical protein
MEIYDFDTSKEASFTIVQASDQIPLYKLQIKYHCTSFRPSRNCSYRKVSFLSTHINMMNVKIQVYEKHGYIYCKNVKFHFLPRDGFFSIHTLQEDS